MIGSLRDIAASLTSRIELRLFKEYGAIFITQATPPSTIIFADESEVEGFQAGLAILDGAFGEHRIELQASAMETLASAASELAGTGGSITARAADAGRRSYEDTVGLWKRNVTRGMQHWSDLGRISRAQANSILEMRPVDQVAEILDLEDREQIYFGTFFDRSILYSVAAPGASQHLSLLAFDVKEYQDESVESVLARHGWFRTVVNDLPHFTYIGRSEDELSGLGLKRVVRVYGDKEFRFWIPDLD